MNQLKYKWKYKTIHINNKMKATLLNNHNLINQ